MTRFNRFIDGVDFIPIESDWTPRSTSQLLSKLGVRSKSKEEQRFAIASWLKTNEPAPFLRMCLQDDGFLTEASTQAVPRHSAA
jgi:hypothetical protein